MQLDREKWKSKAIMGLEQFQTVGVARGPAPPNWNATNDKNVTKRLLFLQFQFLLASSRSIVHAYNRN